MSLLLNPWTWLGILLAAAGLFGAGEWDGYHRGSRKLDDYIARQTQKQTALDDKVRGEQASIALREYRKEERRYAEFQSLQDRARHVRGPDIVLVPEFVRVWADTVDSANRAGIEPGRDERSTAIPEAAATEEAYDPADIAVWITEAGNAYAMLKGKWSKCVASYNALKE